MLDKSKVQSVTNHLKRASAICDSGYAFAIHIRYTRPSLLYRTYHQQWIDHYSEQGFMMVDPVVHWGLAATGSVEWDSLIESDPQGVVASAKAHGLHNGWTYAMGDTSSRSIAGMTKTSAFTADEKAELIRIVNDLHQLTESLDALDAATRDALRAIG